MWLGTNSLFRAYVTSTAALNREFVPDHFCHFVLSSSAICRGGQGWNLVGRGADSQNDVISFFHIDRSLKINLHLKGRLPLNLYCQPEPTNLNIWMQSRRTGHYIEFSCLEADGNTAYYWSISIPSARIWVQNRTEILWRRVGLGTPLFRPSFFQDLGYFSSACCMPWAVSA